MSKREIIIHPNLILVWRTAVVCLLSHIMRYNGVGQQARDKVKQLQQHLYFGLMQVNHGVQREVIMTAHQKVHYNVYLPHELEEGL
jgi:hypothetical protein